MVSNYRLCFFYNKHVWLSSFQQTGAPVESNSNLIWPKQIFSLQGNNVKDLVVFLHIDETSQKSVGINLQIANLVKWDENKRVHINVPPLKNT